MVNYFAYEYPAPTGAAPVSITTEVGAAPWAPAHRLVRVGLRARSLSEREAPPSNLVFLIDVSGSMQSDDKLPLLKAGLRMLVEALRPQDRVAIVTYAGSEGLVLASTPGSEKARILAVLDDLRAGGSTNGGAGIELAYRVARENARPGSNSRVILATDGDFNVGVSSEDELVRLIEAKRREGTYLTVLGFGTGNLQDREMEALADHGNGNYAYIDGEREARKTLVRELTGTLVAVARDVKAQVEFNPARVAAYRLIGYENRALEDWEFDDDARDGGEMGAGHTVTALYEVVPVGVTVPGGPSGALRYGRPARTGRAASAEMLFVKVRYQSPRGGRSRLLTHVVPDRVAPVVSSDFRFAAAVAGFGMLLRASPHKGATTPGMVLGLAEGSVGDDADGDRAEFIDLLIAYRGLAAERDRQAGSSDRP